MDYLSNPHPQMCDVNTVILLQVKEDSRSDRNFLNVFDSCLRKFSINFSDVSQSYCSFWDRVTIQHCWFHVEWQSHTHTHTLTGGSLSQLLDRRFPMWELFSYRGPNCSSHCQTSAGDSASPPWARRLTAAVHGWLVLTASLLFRATVSAGQSVTPPKCVSVSSPLLIHHTPRWHRHRLRHAGPFQRENHRSRWWILDWKPDKCVGWLCLRRAYDRLLEDTRRKHLTWGESRKMLCKSSLCCADSHTQPLLALFSRSISSVHTGRHGALDAA